MQGIKAIAAKNIISGKFELIDRFLSDKEQRDFYLSPDLFMSCLDKTDKELEAIKQKHETVVKRYQEVAKQRSIKYLKSTSVY